MFWSISQLTLPIHEDLQLYASQYKQKTQHPSHPLHKHTTYFNTPRLKNHYVQKRPLQNKHSHRLLCICVDDVMDVVFSVFIVMRGAVDAHVWESVSVSSCRCCMFVSWVNLLAVLKAAFCMNCSLLMLVEGARGDLRKEICSMVVPAMRTRHRTSALRMPSTLSAIRTAQS